MTAADRAHSRSLATRITRDTSHDMAEVSIRDLRNRGGDIVERAASGEPITVTSSGIPVARLTALPPGPIAPEQLLVRWRRLPPIDAAALRADVDAVLDSRI